MTTGCAFPECDRPLLVQRYGLCHSHNEQRKAGQDLRALRPRAANGSGYKRSDGYRILSLPGGRMLEHQYVMTQKLGRPLLPGENVHHINGVKDDNRPENLELWVIRQPRGQRVEDVVAEALELLRVYHPGALVPDALNSVS